MSNREIVDKDLQHIEIGNRKYYKYILFRSTLSEMKMCSLHINNINNVLVKHEFINNASILDKVKYQEKTGILRDIILEVKNNKSW